MLQRIAIVAPFCAALAACASVKPPVGGDVRPDDDPTAQQAVLALEQALADAAQANDVRAIERLEAPEFVSTSAGGKVTTRADDLAQVAAAAIAYSPLAVDERRVRIYGDTAISTFHVRYTYEYQGATYRREQRYTNTWIRRGGAWQVVASHYSTYGDSTRP